jgi:hypothetical protein
MKSIFLLVILFFCSQILAQHFKVDKPVVCSDPKEIYAQLADFNESPVWMSASPAEKSEYIFFFSKESGTWSLIQHRPSESVACLVAYGEMGRRVAL